MPTPITPASQALYQQLRILADACTQLRFCAQAAQGHIDTGVATDARVRNLANTQLTALVNSATTIATSLDMTFRLNTLSGQYVILDNP